MIANKSNKKINDYLKCARQLREALPQAISIDNLLDAHRSDEVTEICGKLGIVKCIQESETNSKLYYNIQENSKLNFNKISGTWFAEFMKILTEGVAKSELDGIFSNVSFISFNYDRCIEHYLYNAIQVYYGISEIEAKAVLSKLEVHHPYGQIGRLPWQEGNNPVFQFGDERIKLLEIAKEIKTFNERIHDKTETIKLRQAFQEAEVIVFLGFAFHRQNLGLLDPSGECPSKT